VGLRADGTRWTVTQVEAAAASAETFPVTADSILVATGGARGVTAAALLALAADHHPRMLLIGRTELADEPDFLAAAHDERTLTRLLAEQARAQGDASSAPSDLVARARTILAVREVRATLSGLEQAGSIARYAALDVTDRAALDRELARVRREWGPITGLVHGAGVLADKRIADKTDEQFDRVYSTKVAGLCALLEATASDPLDLLCVFSSVAARYGNAGQSDYAMANETLNHVACAERARRPSCRVRSIGWGPWEGGMVTPLLAAHFVRRGVPLIPLGEGARAFVAEVGAADDAVQVLIGAGEGSNSLTARSGVAALAARPHVAVLAARPRVAAEVAVDVRTHGFLADHAPAGTPVLPLALAVEWFAAAGRSCYPDRETTLRDIRVLSRIDLPNLETGGHRFTIEGAAPDDDPGAIDLRLTASSGSAHYRARLVAPDDAPMRWRALTAPRQVADNDARDADDVYETSILFHGPRFQTLRRLDALSADGAEARVVGVGEMRWPGGPWWTDPAAIDGALQAALLWVRHATGYATLPMGVDTLRVRRAGAAPGTMQCLVRAGVGAVVGDDVRCDVVLIDGDGEPRAELLGVSLIRRPDLVPARGVEIAADASQGSK
jgi:NAD(P)-dependent dehydrogenase (short-subunit alcohol dehydrogenase family)